MLVATSCKTRLRDLEDEACSPHCVGHAARAMLRAPHLLAGVNVRLLPRRALLDFELGQAWRRLGDVGGGGWMGDLESM